MKKTIEPNWSPGEFTPVGVLDVTPAALELAQAFVEEGKRTLPGKDWVATFDWYLSQMTTYPDGSREQSGPDLDIGALERHEIPPGRIATIDGIEFAIQIPKDVCEAASERLIDCVDETATKVVLK